MSTAVENRVPHIVLLYWVIKIAATTLGETAADMFSMTLELGYSQTIAIFMALFTASMVTKLVRGRYHPALYWSTFTASAIAGTAISDFLDRTLELGYAGGSLLLVVLLIAVLVGWYRREGSIDVDHVTTAPAETLYWIAFLLANTLGTAAGDFLADDLQLGFVVSAALIAAALVALALLHSFTKAPRVVLFWLAFVLTRPFGATFGDLLTKPAAKGGLDFGTVGSSAVFAAILVVALLRETQLERARTDEPQPTG
ncbi:MAG: hypothetical protein KC731_01000 [Myxococcales bacterium]|nr:hypothetical protein [Myxococcales bacterium]